MKANDKSEIIQRYTTRLNEKGAVPEALGWLKQRQKFRFHFLTEIDNFGSKDSVLDIGCAFGDLEPYLRGIGWRGRYKGIDIVPSLIEAGLKKHPNLDIVTLDIQNDKLPEKFDWVFSSGALTSKTKDINSYDHLEQMLEIMYSLCNKGVSVNLLSPFVDYESDINFHPELPKFFDIVNKISKRYSLRFDYMPYEFTLYMYKDDEIMKHSTVYRAHEALFERLKTK